MLPCNDSLLLYSLPNPSSTTKFVFTIKQSSLLSVTIKSSYSLLSCDEVSLALLYSNIIFLLFFSSSLIFTFFSISIEFYIKLLNTFSSINLLHKFVSLHISSLIFLFSLSLSVSIVSCDSFDTLLVSSTSSFFIYFNKLVLIQYLLFSPTVEYLVLNPSNIYLFHFLN